MKLGLNTGVANLTSIRSVRLCFCGQIYAVGGFDGVNRLRDGEVYSPATNSWTNISNMKTPRSNFGVEVIGDKLLVAGGYNGERTTGEVEVYDDATNDWSVVIYLLLLIEKS